MLINLRNALMAGKRLPYDAEVEYIRGDGRSGIDTGLKPVVGWKYDFTFTPRAGFNGCIFGAGQGNDYLQIVQGHYAKFVLYHSTAPRQVDLGLVAGTTYHCVFDSSALIMNGVSQDGLWGTKYISRNIAILARYYDNSLGFNSSNIDLHCFKIYDANDGLIFNAIPVRVGTTGYLYDRVSGKLFGNAGTGDFVLGPDVVPVEYIESTGTQYIDTGLLGRDGYDFEYRIRPMNPLPSGIGGEYENDKNCYIGLVRSNGYLAYNYYSPNNIVEVQPLTLGMDYNVKAHLYSGEQYFEVNGVRGGVGSRTGAFTSSYNLYLFAINSANQPTSLGVMRLYNFTAHLNTIPTRSFRPVRVGTDATSWEGAMMDTLTRRIYRNAGTGAFSYGNDLKYPIPA